MSKKRTKKGKWEVDIPNKEGEGKKAFYILR